MAKVRKSLEENYSLVIAIELLVSLISESKLTFYKFLEMLRIPYVDRDAGLN